MVTWVTDHKIRPIISSAWTSKDSCLQPHTMLYNAHILTYFRLNTFCFPHFHAVNVLYVGIVKASSHLYHQTCHINVKHINISRSDRVAFHPHHEFHLRQTGCSHEWILPTQTADTIITTHLQKSSHSQHRKAKAKAKVQVLGIAPLNMRSTCQRRFTIVEVVTDRHWL